MARRWLLPLAAISDIPNFNNTSVPGENHFFITKDKYSSVWPWRSYRTSPHTPPHMDIIRHGGELADGYVFLTPTNHKSKEGTHELSGTGFIMTTDGDMIFAGEEKGYDFCDDWVAGMTDFRVQQYNGRPYITYWNGCNTKSSHDGHRWGRVTFIDEEYKTFTVNPDLGINSLDEANKGQIDVHEHQMTDDGTMVVTSYNNTQEDMRMFGGSEDTWVAEGMFFEFDIERGEVLFKWKAMDHISLMATQTGLQGARGTKHVPWDWIHTNSVQKVGKNYLISARHHWAIYFISGEDGSVLWKLDGADGGSFGSIPAGFKWQHHARAHNISEHGMTVSLFNNNGGDPYNPNDQAQALAFYISLPATPANPPQLIRRLETRQEMVQAGTQGSYQLDLGNGNGFVGYGKTPLVREYGPAEDGSDLRWQAWFGHDDSTMSYRSFKAEWHGLPKDWDPVALFEPVLLQRGTPAKVYVSWNGATDISDWAVFAGDDQEDLKSMGVVPREGFETAFNLDSAQCVQLGAIRDGKIVRSSNIACRDDELQTEKEKLEAEIEELEDELDELESGVLVSYPLVLVVACFVVIVVAAICAFRFWHNRRRRLAHHRINSDEGMSGFTDREERKYVSVIPIEASQYDEQRPNEAVAPLRHHELVEGEPFGLADDDTTDDEEHVADSRTPFMRSENQR